MKKLFLIIAILTQFTLGQSAAQFLLLMDDNEEFNPLTLPNYQAGYLMNYTTDDPQGSINPVLVSGQWFDMADLTGASKVLNRSNTTATDVVNGFRCHNLASALITNSTVDVLSGVTDFTICIGFKRPVHTTDYHILLAASNSAGTVTFLIGIRNTGKLLVNCYGTTQSIEGDLDQTTYDNNEWHVAVISVSQTLKTVKVITDLESKEFDNPLYVADVMTPSSSNQFQLGRWNVAPFNIWDGLVGDLLIFNSALDPDVCNSLLTWEKERLGI